MNPNDVQQTTALISKHFGVEQNEFATIDQNEAYSSLVKHVTRVVAYLLDKDITRLLSGLYIIDVDENAFKKILAEADSDKVAEEVAKLIIERELKKVEFRRKYS